MKIDLSLANANNKLTAFRRKAIEQDLPGHFAFLLGRKEIAYLKGLTYIGDKRSETERASRLCNEMVIPVDGETCFELILIAAIQE